jgi:hypothetical protein
MVKWKPEKNKLIKTIIDINFDNRTDANIKEYSLIKENINNPLNRNYALPSVNWEYSLTGEKNHFFGKRHTDKSINQMKESAKTRNISDEMEETRRSNISKTMKGIPKSQEFKDNLKNIRVGKGNPMFGKPAPNRGLVYEKTECTACGRLIAKHIIHINHNENCKTLKST